MESACFSLNPSRCRSSKLTVLGSKRNDSTFRGAAFSRTFTASGLCSASFFMLVVFALEDASGKPTSPRANVSM